MTTFWGKSTIYEYLEQDIPNGNHIFMTGPSQDIVLNVRILNRYEDVTLSGTTTVSASAGATYIDVLKVYGTLTVAEGAATPIFAGGNLLTVVYATNDLIVKGTITRNGMSVASSFAESTPIATLYIHKNADDTLEFIPGVGGKGADSSALDFSSLRATNGASGEPGASASSVLTLDATYTRATGGGGNGSLAGYITNTAYLKTVYGYKGTIGRSAGGGIGGLGLITINGSTSFNQYVGSGNIGGGSLLFFCEGVFDITTTGYIQARGNNTSFYTSIILDSNPVPAYHVYSGAGGGGSINIFYRNSPKTLPQLASKCSATGGVQGPAAAYRAGYFDVFAGNGGDGSVTLNVLGEVPQERIRILDENMLDIQGVSLGRAIQGSYTNMMKLFLENRYAQKVSSLTLTWEHSNPTLENQAILEFSTDGKNFIVGNAHTFTTVLFPGQKHTIYVRGLTHVEQVVDTYFDLRASVTAV